MIVKTSWGWSVELTDEQGAAGLLEAKRSGFKHHPVWKKMVDCGVPVRDEAGKLSASLAATALVDLALRELGE